MTDKNLPVMSIRVRDIEVAIWNNEKETNGHKYIFDAVTIVKHFVNADKTYGKTDNFRLADIPKIVLALNKVFENNMISNVVQRDVKDDLN